MNQRNIVDRGTVHLADRQGAEISDAGLTQIYLVGTLPKATQRILVVRHTLLLRHDKDIACFAIVAIHLARQRGDKASGGIR
ncbi:hypothetical protein D3C84_793950 [compost metagenome]